MAKKIIKPGADLYRAECLECGCVFTYERSDVSSNGSVDCPHCEKLVAHNPRSRELL